jgi:hypothetical protein
MSTEVSDGDIIQLIDRMGVDHTKGIDFQVFKRILMLFPSRYTRSLARLLSLHQRWHARPLFTFIIGAHPSTLSQEHIYQQCIRLLVQAHHRHRF